MNLGEFLLNVAFAIITGIIVSFILKVFLIKYVDNLLIKKMAEKVVKQDLTFHQGDGQAIKFDVQGNKVVGIKNVGQQLAQTLPQAQPYPTNPVPPVIMYEKRGFFRWLFRMKPKPISTNTNPMMQIPVQQVQQPIPIQPVPVVQTAPPSITSQTPPMKQRHVKPMIKPTVKKQPQLNELSKEQLMAIVEELAKRKTNKK